MKGAVQGVQRSMEGQENERLKPAQIDLRKMAYILLPKAWLILLVAVLGGLAAFLYTHFMITPLYTANVTLYVRSTQTRLDGSDSVNYNELVIAQHITDTYITVHDGCFGSGRYLHHQCEDHKRFSQACQADGEPDCRTCARTDGGIYRGQFGTNFKLC